MKALRNSLRKDHLVNFTGLQLDLLDPLIIYEKRLFMVQINFYNKATILGLHYKRRVLVAQIFLSNEFLATNLIGVKLVSVCLFVCLKNLRALFYG